MELFFLFVLLALLVGALGMGFPVAFALPGAAILSIGLATGAGVLFEGAGNAYFAHGSAVEWLTAGVTNLRGIYWEADRDTLIAIPLFIFMGIMLQRSRIAETLLVTMARLFGALPGGLGISVIVVGALLAATTGIVGATVVAMGLISLPAMMRANYAQPLATGTILASGTLGQIIPPSIVLIILADQLSNAVDQAGALRLAQYREATGATTLPSELGVTSASAGDMFMGALIPGLILVAFYIVFVLVYALLKPASAPAMPREGSMDLAFWVEVGRAVVPPIGLIVLVLGSIIAGIATVAQAGAIGAAGATLMAGTRLAPATSLGRWVPAVLVVGALAAIVILSANFNLNVRALDRSGDHLAVWLAVAAVALLLLGLGWSAVSVHRHSDTLRAVMLETAKTTALVFIILLGAAMLVSAFRGFGGEELVRDFLFGLPGGFWTQFLLVMLVIFILGFFLDFIEIAIVVVPIVAPILLANPDANITAIWLGVMIGLNIQTSFLTPPFGFALFYLRGVAAASVKTLAMYKGVIPFILLQLTALGVVGMHPPLVNWLPMRVTMLSENAPPPRNPRLMFCVEEVQTRDLGRTGPAIAETVARLRDADASALPDAAARRLDEALDGTAEGLEAMEDLAAARAATEAAAPDYRPLHTAASDITRDAARLQSRIEQATRDLRDHRGDAPETLAAREVIEARIAALEAERAALLDSKPDAWPEARAAYADLLQAEQQARLAVRRTGEAGHAAAADLAASLAATDDLAALTEDITALPERIDPADPEAAAELIRELELRIGEIAGAQGLRSALADVRRTLTGRDASPEDAPAEAAAIAGLLAEEIAWREAAAPLRADLETLVTLTAGNLGLREQPRFARDQALAVASCMADHRSIALRF